MWTFSVKCDQQKVWPWRFHQGLFPTIICYLIGLWSKTWSNVGSPPSYPISCFFIPHMYYKITLVEGIPMTWAVWVCGKRVKILGASCLPTLPETSIYEWLFQWDDSISLLPGTKFNSEFSPEKLPKAPNRKPLFVFPPVPPFFRGKTRC